jgi:hypothetical protein
MGTLSEPARLYLLETEIGIWALPARNVRGSEGKSNWEISRE